MPYQEFSKIRILFQLKIKPVIKTGLNSGAPRRIPSHGTYGAGCGAFVTIWPRLACQIYSLSNPFVRVQILGLAHNKKTTPRNRDVVVYSGAPRRIRTLNLLIRSQMLYPIEPWAQRSYILYFFIAIASKNVCFFICCLSLCCQCRDKAY